MQPPSDRIALFIRSLKGNGAERSTVNLAIALAERGAAVDLVLVKAEGTFLADVPPSVRIVDLDVKSGFGAFALAVRRWPDFKALLPVFNPWPPFSLAAIPALERYLRTERPRALLSALDLCNVAAVIAGGLANVGTRIVVSQRNHPSVHHGSVGSAKVSKRGSLLARFYPRADAIVSVSDGVADDLAASTGLPRDRITTIYNAVYDERLAERAALEPAHPWFSDGGAPIILAAGKLKKQKDFDALLRAFARVRAKRHARLIIAGEGEEREALEALVIELGLSGHASLPGFIDNPYAMMARADLFVLCSRFEGLPGVLIQALACGCPVVSTDCPSGPQEILEGGRWGPLTPVGDVEALADAIEATLTAPPNRSELKTRGAFFSGERAAETYHRVLVGDAA